MDVVPTLLPIVRPADLTVLELIETPIWLFDPVDLVHLWANGAGLALWGVERVDELRARDLASSVSGRMRDQLEQLRSAVERGEVLRADETLLPLGQGVRARLVCRGVRTSPTGRALVLVEAHAAVVAEATADRSHGVLDAIPTAAALFDEHGFVMWENERARSLFAPRAGRRPMLPERLARPGAFDGIFKKLARGMGFEGDLELETVAGVRWHMLDARMMTDHVTGERVIVVTHTDIDRWKAAELALREAKDVAERANRSKSEFLANMSHEIRTPMNGVLGSIELLARSSLDDGQARLVDIVQRSARTLLAILNDILDLSRIEAGKLHLELIDFRLAETVADVVRLHAETARKKGLDLQMSPFDALPDRVVGDPVRLSQILGNLLSNAIKFTEAGHVRVDAMLAEAAPGEVVVRFTVRDTGPGIGPDERERIFAAFEQADGSITRRFGGTGLGLTISRRLARLMGGDLTLESAPGEGACFGFTVRLSVRSERGETLDILPDENLQGRRAWIVASDAMDPMLRSALVGAGLDVRRRTWVDLEQAPADPPFVLLIEMGSEGQARLPAWVDGRTTVVGWTLEARHRPSDYDALLVGPVSDASVYACLSRLGGTRRAIPGPDEARPEERLGGLRVLLVEDNPINQEVAVGMLESFECRVTCAENGAEALERLREASFDVVLMDCQMPVMDGFTATRAIRSLEADRTARTPIVALTANAMTGDRERCLASGMDDFLAKPFSLQDLAAKLAAWAGPGR